MQNTQLLPRTTPGLPRFHFPSLRAVVRMAVMSAMAITLSISVLVAAAIFIPGVFGLKTMVVTSGSMQPYLNPGDVALVRAAVADEVALGDAISFYRPDGRGLITHRVIDIKILDGVLYFQTQGDNNLAADANLTPANALFGVVHGRIPKIGYLLQKVTTDKLIRMLTLSVPVIVIAVQELRSLSKSAKQAGAKNSEAKSRLALSDETSVA